MVGVHLVDPDVEWQCTWGEKKKMFGKKNLIAVGGKTEGAAYAPVTNKMTIRWCLLAIMACH